MNNDIDKRLDELLDKIPKPSYDVESWLTEDETQMFDSLMRKRRQRTIGRWVAVAACLLIICIGVLLYKEQTQSPQTMVIVKAEQPPQTKVEKSEEVALPIITESKTITQNKVKRTKNKHNKRAKRQKHSSEKEPVMETIPMDKPSTMHIVNVYTCGSIENDPYIIPVSHTQNIRQRGERLEREIARMMEF